MTQLVLVSPAPEIVDVGFDVFFGDVDHGRLRLKEASVVAPQGLILLLLAQLQLGQTGRLRPVAMEGTCEEPRESVPGVDAVPGQLLEPLQWSIRKCNGEVVDLVIAVSARSLDCSGI